LADVGPAVAALIAHEHARQFSRLIMIASESSPPAAIREGEGSVFSNIYAEGDPHEAMRTQTEDEILDFDRQLTFYRRQGDCCHYKGVEYIPIIRRMTWPGSAFQSRSSGSQSLRTAAAA
jgi:hypothetical protein